jgi:hypothetical protein
MKSAMFNPAYHEEGMYSEKKKDSFIAQVPMSTNFLAKKQVALKSKQQP